MPADGLKAAARRPGRSTCRACCWRRLATLGLGLVLGPEGPLIALGIGLGILAMQLVRRDAPDQAVGLMAAAGSFAAVSTIFGSPVIGAVLIIEATGLGGPMLPLVLLPGLLAAGIGSLVFIGLGSWSGLQHRRLVAEPVPAAAVRRPGLGRLRLDDPAGRRRRRRRLRDPGARPLVEARGRPAAVRADDRGRSRRRRPCDRLRGGDRRSPDAVLFSGEDAFGSLFASGGDDLALDAGAAARCSRGSPGPSRWAASAAARPSRRSSSASSPGSWPRTCPATPRRRPSPR